MGKETHLFDSFAHAAIALEKAWNEDDHPRWPKKAPDGQGGRFTAANFGTGASGPTESAPGIGHNGGPPLDDRPRLPSELPPTRQLINSILKRLARWLVRKGLTRLIPFLGEVLLVLDGASWIKDYMPYIQAYCEPPHSLDQLAEAANHPVLGYDIHHIVEQTPARNDGFSDDQIESGDNRVRISTLKHWEITGWYNTKTDRYNGLTPRQYLRGKSWEERRRVGIQALIDSGVLKP